MGCGGSSDSADRAMRRQRISEDNQRFENQIAAGRRTMPRSESLTKYSKAAKDFIEKEKFRKLAREKNIKLNGQLIQSKINIKHSTIRLVQDEEEKNIYWINFHYSATEQVEITAYICATQYMNSDGVPRCFSIPQELPSAKKSCFDRGKDCKIEFHDTFKINIQDYEGMPLFKGTNNFYPLILTISPTAQPNIDEDGVSDSQCLITYCTFSIDKSTNALSLAPQKQILVAFEMGFLLQQIYGIDDAFEEEHKGEVGMTDGLGYEIDDAQLCVVCMSEEKNTIVMPCGHLCICKECADTIAKGNHSDCPICRNKAQSFVPLNIRSIRKVEEEILKHTETVDLKNKLNGDDSPPSVESD